MTDSIDAYRKFTANFLAIGLSFLCTSYISLAIATADLSGLPLAQIVVGGNTKTLTRFVLKWAEISVGMLLLNQNWTRPDKIF